MSAATLDASPSPAEVLDLAHPSAIAIAALPVEARRAAAARAAQDRRADLALYVDLYAERYGHRLDLHVVEDADQLLGELVLLAIA